MSLGWRVRSGLRSYVEGVEGVDPLFDKVFLAAGSHPISIIIFIVFNIEIYPQHPQHPQH